MSTPNPLEKYPPYPLPETTRSEPSDLHYIVRDVHNFFAK
jgi:hypothetical protein